jgi:chemotaxis protein methyltransferase CheR
MPNFKIQRLAELLSIECERRYGISATEAVKGKIEELLLTEEIPTFERLLQGNEHNANWQKIIEKITIHEGYFHRNKNILDSIAKKIEQILEQKKSIRIWSVPCATGEEAYDLAFITIELLYKQHYGTATLSENLLNSLNLDNVYIYATDISELAIIKAKSGEYDDLTMGPLRKLDYTKKKYFFEQKGGFLAVKPFVKNAVKFVSANVLNPPLQNNFDIIVCRNMLIYFSDEQKLKCQQQLESTLAPGGFLFLGSVDPFMLDSKKFISHSDNNAIWYEKRIIT